MTARARRLLVAAIVLGLALSGCGQNEDPADEEAFCTALRQSIDQNVTVFDPQDPADPEEARATLDELVELAPEEIVAEVTVLRDAFTELADAIAAADVADPETTDPFADVDLDEERIARAQSAMAAYGRDPCRIPLLNGPASATTTTTSPPGASVPGSSGPDLTGPRD